MRYYLIYDEGGIIINVGSVSQKGRLGANQTKEWFNSEEDLIARVDFVGDEGAYENLTNPHPSPDPEDE